MLRFRSGLNKGDSALADFFVVFPGFSFGRNLISLATCFKDLLVTNLGCGSVFRGGDVLANLGGGNITKSLK
jgi:hypothetical protein